MMFLWSCLGHVARVRLRLLSIGWCYLTISGFEKRRVSVILIRWDIQQRLHKKMVKRWFLVCIMKVDCEDGLPAFAFSAMATSHRGYRNFILHFLVVQHQLMFKNVIELKLIWLHLFNEYNERDAISTIIKTIE